jgi:flavodoxin
MSILVVYYSRTGTTKKVAERIVQDLGCETEQLFDTKNRKGPLGYMGAGKDSSTKRLTELKPIQKNPGAYELVVIGTPIWAWKMSTPIRTYIQMYKNKFANVAFFITCIGKPTDTLQEMETLIGKRPVSTLLLTRKDFKEGTDGAKVQKFINDLK